MNWLILILAGIMEIGWALGLKYSANFTRPIPSALTVIAMAISIWLLSYTLKTIPLGTAYAIWTGIGAAGTVIMGIMLFDEPATFARLACVGLIIAGIIGLKFLSAS